jgi:hypothetical protein
MGCKSGASAAATMGVEIGSDTGIAFSGPLRRRQSAEF